MGQIGVVIVTYNRLEKLKIALSKFDDQTNKPAYMIVVDNASNDGTHEYLKTWENPEQGRIVITEEKNTGGSGGFHRGLSEAITGDSEWIWVSDDDAFPERDALENAETFIKDHDEIDRCVAICGEVINNGKVDTEHRRRMKQKGLIVKDIPVDISEYQKACFELNCFTYVGTIIRKSALLKVGLTKKEYFIWCDDTEHSLRLSKAGKIKCIPKIKIYHDAPEDSLKFSWKTYYGIRNLGDTYKNHFPGICYYNYCIGKYLKAKINKLIKREVVKNKLICTAIEDSLKDHLGINSVYKPGWK